MFSRQLIVPTHGTHVYPLPILTPPICVIAIFDLPDWETMSSVRCEQVKGSIVTVRAGSKKNPVFYNVDLTNLEQLGPLYFSKNPKSPCYVTPQKRELLKRYIGFLTPEHIQKYLVNFVKKGVPCTPRRVYYICTNFCRKYPELTTYQIQRRDFMTGELGTITIVLWEEYPRRLHVEPRYVNDFFQRRKRRVTDMANSSASAPDEMPSDIVLCRVGPSEFVTTASVQIVFLNMIHSIRLLDQVPKWLPLVVEDQYASLVKRNEEVAKCKEEGRVYRRRALNPVKLARGGPLQSF
jgi:hypothetical protein